MPILVGAPRSGTTLLRLMLDAHPDLAIPPETGFLAAARAWAGTPGIDATSLADLLTTFPPEAPAWDDFGIPATDLRRRLSAVRPFEVPDGIRAFYRAYAERFGASRWGDKTPVYCRHIVDIEAVLPEARFVHIVRDGRDVAVSLRQRWFSPGHDIDVQAEFWRTHVMDGHEQGQHARHYLEVRFEDLVRHPARTLATICDFVEIDLRPEMLAHHERAPARLAEHGARYRVDGSLVVSREERMSQQRTTTRPPDPSEIGRARTELTSDEWTRFGEVAGDALRLFGYEVGTEDPAAGS